MKLSVVIEQLLYQIDQNGSQSVNMLDNSEIVLEWRMTVSFRQKYESVRRDLERSNRCKDL